MVRKRLAQPDCVGGFILDGFPRTLRQAELLSQFVDIRFAILLDLDEVVLIQTTCGRRTCGQCGRGYNLADIQTPTIRMPPLAPVVDGKCDTCNGDLVRRADDYEDVVRTRLSLYHSQTEPLIDYYRNNGLLKTFEVRQGKRDWPRLLEFFKHIAPDQFDDSTVAKL